MAVDHELWRSSFSENSIPHFPCPTCEHGRLTLRQGTLTIEDPVHSIAQSHDPNFDPTWVVSRFVALLDCGGPTCGEIVAMTGDVRRTRADSDDGWGEPEEVYPNYLHPASLHPAPPVISVPHETPEGVRAEVRLSWQLMWVDAGAAAGRLRTSAERLLDHFKIARTRINKHGKRVDNPLNNRIEAFERKKPGFKSALHALRIVGNLGTHKGAEREPLLDAYALYEDALSEIFGKRTKKLQRLAGKITKTRGVYKRE